MTIGNSIPNGALFMKLMKGNLFNEETRRKDYEQKMHRPSSHKVEEETGIEDRKVMIYKTSLREGPNPEIKSNVAIVEKMSI